MFNFGSCFLRMFVLLCDVFLIYLFQFLVLKKESQFSFFVVKVSVWCLEVLIEEYIEFVSVSNWS